MLIRSLPWTEQPHAGPNYSHPAADPTGILWSGASMRGGGVNAPTSVVSMSSVATQAGIGATSSTTGYVLFPNAVAKASDFTVGVQFRAGTDLTGGQQLFGRVLESSPWPFNWVMDLNGSTLRFFSNADSYATLSVAGIVSGAVYTVVGTVTAGKVWKLFVNGVQQATRTGTADPTTTGAQETRIGTNNGGVYPLKAGTAVTWAYAANRALPDAAAAELSANPWQLFEPARIWVPVSVAAGGDVSVALSGQSVTTSAGTLAPANSVALSGQSVTTSAGTITPSIGTDVALTGSAVTTSAGTLGVSTSVALSGSAVTVSAGTLTVESPDVTVALSGVSVSADAGTVTPVGGTVVVSQQAAGRSRRRRRYEVEIDGKTYDVESPEEAQQVLEQVAKDRAALAIERATKAAKRPTRKVLRDAEKTLKAPEVKAPAELAGVVDAAMQSVRDVYAQAFRDIQIAALMRDRDRALEEDDEDILMLL